MGRLVLALGLWFVAVGAGRMWWASIERERYGGVAGVQAAERVFDSGRGWLVAGAILTGLGFPRGKEARVTGFDEMLRVKVKAARPRMDGE